MASATHTLEADLRANREAAELTIDDVHQETRLASDIISRFEAGQLIDDPAFNIIYLKAFLRSYAEAVGVPSHKVEAALEAVRTGAYRGELHPDYAEDGFEVSEKAAAASESEPDDTDVEAPLKKRASFPKVDPLPPPMPASSPAVAGPSTVSYRSARPTKRLQKKARSGSGKSFDTAWGAILGVTVLLVLAAVAVLWLLFRNASPETDAVALDTPDSVEASSEDSIAAAGSSGTPSAQRLTFPIEVTVVAGGDGLQSFRVTEAPGERRPVWIEPGETISFSSSQGIVLWGEGGLGMNPEEVTLRFQGYEWKPPRGQVLRIDNTYGQTLLDSLHATFPGSGNAAPQP